MTKGTPNKSSAKQSPYFRHKRRQICENSPYFPNAPSSPFGAMQSLGSLWHCLGASIIASNSGTLVEPNIPTVHQIRNTLRHFEACPVFQKRYGKSSSSFDSNNDSRCLTDRTQHLEISVRHLCTYRCYYRAYAPARAWWALREKVQSQTCLPIQSLLQGWSCLLMMPSTNKVVFVDPSHRVVWNEQDVLHQILGPQRRIQRRVERYPVLPQRIWFDSTTDERPTKRSKSSCPRRIVCTDSPFGLLEELFVENPFQLLLSTILLNRTTRIQVDPVLYELLQHWPTPESLFQAELDSLIQVVRPLGMGYRRAMGLLQFARDYLTQDNSKYQDVMELYYCGPYAQDAYRLFIQKNASIKPLDHALRAYARYQRGVLADQEKKA
ncbi:methyl-CpG-binding domain protein 4 [Fistulifera solaris]|uniref:Methyl-CpG-binding domain protein 4 n=1 Tax=Fistulifera solaris TaxID=1519565 RepID=A0A1Z5JIX9_FISSO|nr:methyl-CpG-binding domain protein 4 [Fistulifera solaris]|eukprot:GAX13738.1 methyl-CpG-binding domain protein 4 [Fistulifera solaris]